MSAGELTRPDFPAPTGRPSGRSRRLPLPFRRDPQDPRRQAARNGLPIPPDPREPLPRQLLRKRMFWLTVVMLVVYATLLVLLYQQIVPDQRTRTGIVPGLGEEAVPLAAKYAAITLIPLSLLFVITDRFRPQRFWVWFMTLGWGACVATLIAAQVNTWAAGYLSIQGDGDPASATRAAIYVAPWVEEACKATVLFWLAILMRYQWVSRVSGIVLAGLSGAGFAFTENILYYGRAYHYASQTIGVTPDQAIQELFWLRGVKTFFGHPLFTSMTGIGLAIGMRSKSKVVRVVAPLAGYCAAAFLHMSFNTTASLAQGTQLVIIYLAVALPLVAGVVIFTVRQIFREGRLIRERLTDYARMGWVPTEWVVPGSRLRTRLRALWHALFLGPRTLVDTVLLQRSLTELAYLRDAMTRGLVDRAGLEREKYLLARLRRLGSSGVLRPEGRAAYPRLRRRATAPVGYAPAAYPGPAGIGGNYPAYPGYPAPPPGQLPGSAPIGPAAVQYSEVDPEWKPPPG
ncbi:RsiW-degrading membrane proteinase PrsW (M82 family) [Friedmanniella endophytica]|uniref:RsiW-degrading membrane proteinase PrsW (M82 family) n=1 Tax=Microlunatus kandeliicorticis TaxID=1759536 RepID=A0A7W3IVP8_9ACTN|nr:PrsW family intramembrane metalloprotease [Microlunatus kandeliicorticis]MBA8796117.1 RsiW-degrading membrane proteinase PrsW (M82 family) [Microlunatus kandeliicorticis]